MSKSRETTGFFTSLVNQDTKSPKGILKTQQLTTKHAGNVAARHVQWPDNTIPTTENVPPLEAIRTFSSSIRKLHIQNRGKPIYRHPIELVRKSSPQNGEEDGVITLSRQPPLNSQWCR